MTFEQALARLEIIAQSMQSQQPLDEALAAYTEGCELVKFCQTKLAEMEQKLQVLDNQKLTELNLDNE